MPKKKIARRILSLSFAKFQSPLYAYWDPPKTINQSINQQVSKKK